MSDTLWPHGIWLDRLPCPRDSPGKNTGVGCHALFQAIFPTQQMNPCLLRLLYWQVGSLLTSTTWEAPWWSLAIKLKKGKWSRTAWLSDILVMLCFCCTWDTRWRHEGKSGVEGLMLRGDPWQSWWLGCLCTAMKVTAVDLGEICEKAEVGTLRMLS